MARLSIGSQHFQAKERRPALSVGQAKVCVTESATEAPGSGPEAVSVSATTNPEPIDRYQQNDRIQQDDENHQGNTSPQVNTIHNDDQGDATQREATKYASQNRMLAMRNSELAMKNTELLGVIEDLEIQIASLKHELEERENFPGIEVEKLVSMLENNHSQVLKYIQTHGKEPAQDDKKSFENLSGVVSTSTPNTSKLPMESSNSLLETSKAELSRSLIETSNLPDFSFNARAESTPNTMRESSDESSTISADLAMFDDRSTLDKTSSRSLIRAESLENILDSVDSGKASKRPVQSPQEPEADPLEYFAKRRALDTRARTLRESKLQPARSVKIEVKNENDDIRGGKPTERKGHKDARKPLSTVSSNVHKKTGKDSVDGIFDFVDKSELLKTKPLKRERRT